MLIPFKKVLQTGIDFQTSIDEMKFHGKLFKKSKTLVECQGYLEGEINHHCDRCAQDIAINVNEPIEIFFHDGVYENEAESLDIIEFLSNEINLNEVLESEIASIKSGYFYCSTCKDES